MKIEYFNRYTKKLEVEKVYGDSATRWLYTSPIASLVRGLVTHPILSQAYGWTQDSRLSGRKVSKFIENFNIPIELFEKGSLGQEDIGNSYVSFNEFFTRRYRQGIRPFVLDKLMPAFAEGRYVGYDKVGDDIQFPVKGKNLETSELIGSSSEAKIFSGGPALICRLCPVDYHRYHYPDEGQTLKNFWVHGPLDSVNPIALKAKGDIFLKNQRRVSILETKHFGKLAFIEVGAVCVGKIVQSYDESKNFNRGDEKGYFLFGGSTVVVVGEAGAWKPSADILDNTKKNLETYVQLGDEVAITVK
jgi:phosphatidylserine decarboxylase